MALASAAEEHALISIWQLVAELSDQLNANRASATALQNQVNALKNQAVNNGTGFVLRRFNADLSREVFDSELEKMNAGLIIENQQLQHENKQLNALLKEYEQTLEMVMTKFRTQAHASQQHELTLTRHYESLLLNRESGAMNQDLVSSTKLSTSLARLSHLIRQAIRANAGEDTEDTDSSPDEPSPPSLPSPPSQDWAMERESEINRLEKENEELRRLLGIDAGGAAAIGATEEEWNGTDMVVRSRGLRGLGVGVGGRRSSGMGRGQGSVGAGGPGGAGPAGGFALQRGWMDRGTQDGLMGR